MLPVPLLQLWVPQARAPQQPSPPLTQAGGRSEERRSRGAGGTCDTPSLAAVPGVSRRDSLAWLEAASPQPQGSAPSPDSPRAQGAEGTSAPPPAPYATPFP